MAFGTQQQHVWDGICTSHAISMWQMLSAIRSAATIHTGLDKATQPLPIGLMEPSLSL